MNLGYRRSRILEDLAKLGFIGQWYPTSPSARLRVFKVGDESEDHIVLYVKGNEIVVGTDFARVPYFGPENEQKMKEYADAIDAYENWLKPFNFKRAEY